MSIKLFCHLCLVYLTWKHKKKVVQQIPGYQEGKVTGICNCNTVLQKWGERMMINSNEDTGQKSRVAWASKSKKPCSRVAWASKSNLTKVRPLFFRYRIGDLITPHCLSCSVLIILTNQPLLLFDWKYFGSLTFWSE
mgnify:CR=1 FL=1